MGGYISKLFYHEEHDKTYEYNTSSLVLENRDTCTPQPQKKKSLIDPRSATLGITRTPIEILNTPQKESSNVISSVPKYLKRKPYLETNFDVTPPSRTLDRCLDPRSPSVDVPRTPITVETFPDNDTPKHANPTKYNKTNLLSEMHQKMLGLDPRSPAVDFDRTPILKPKTLEMEKLCSQENLNTNENEIKLQPSRLSYCETVNSSDIIEINALPDVTLNNSQKSANEIAETSCTSNSGALSNNSIVTVLRKRIESSLEDSSSSSDCALDLKKIENFEDKLIANNSDNLINNVLDIAEKIYENKTNEVENKIKIWRDNQSPVAEEDSEYDSESESDHLENKSPKNDLVIEYDDDVSVVGTLKRTEYNRRKSISVEKKKRNFRKEVETKKPFSPAKKQISEIKKPEVLNNRTPLRNRSNTNSQQQQGFDLKSPHLLRKVLLPSAKFQENTPPRTKKSALKSKFNNTQWDGDSTIII
ncbi:cell division cycle-associated protein 3-like [Leptopilina heterotoma]|uniref:cell division cycle-associated protein 3-like n=1 Tax=Leptopilina heterotoma TaxID=63436 RepID=UPI001CA8D6E9|nr:cell division cycle-associated protein 3-like [Leptopilina heterotoma]